MSVTRFWGSIPTDSNDEVSQFGEGLNCIFLIWVQKYALYKFSDLFTILKDTFLDDTKSIGLIWEF